MTNKLATSFISFALAFTLSFSAFSPTVLQAFAEGSGGSSGGIQPSPDGELIPSTKVSILRDPSACSSVDGIFYFDGEQSMEFHYRDSFFYGDSFYYNPSLATMTAQMSVAGFNYTANGQYAVGYERLRELTEKIGFTNFEANDDYRHVPGANTVGVGIAMKKIRVQGETQDRTLISVTQRSGGYGSEWSGNTTLGSSGEAQGFATGRDEVIRFLTYYLTKYETEIGQNPKIWISGYSRGSAIGNLTGNFIDCAIQTDQGNSTLMQSFRPVAQRIGLKTEDVYCYGIEVPKGGVKDTPYPAKDTCNLHVCVDPNDPVPYVAPKNWGFLWYGNTEQNPTHNPSACKSGTCRSHEPQNSVKDITVDSPYTGPRYADELLRLDAREGNKFINGPMHQPFQPWKSSTWYTLISSHNYDKVDLSDSKVGKTFGEFTEHLLTALCDACGKRSDYNESLQKVAAIMSRIVMDTAEGGKAMDSFKRAFDNNKGAIIAAFAGGGSISDVSTGWAWTIRGVLTLTMFIPGVGAVLNPFTYEGVRVLSNHTLTAALLGVLDDVYKDGYLTGKEYNELMRALPETLSLLKHFLDKDNGNDLSLVTTAIQYGGDLATFHMPLYVIAHLCVSDPLYNGAEPTPSQPSSFRLSVMPESIDSKAYGDEMKYSPDTTVNIYSTTFAGYEKTLLAQVNNGYITYTGAGKEFVDKNNVNRISAVQYKEGMLSIDVADPLNGKKIIFEVSAPSATRTTEVPVRVTYDYFKLSIAQENARQPFENEVLNFFDGDKLTLKCTSDSIECDAQWTYELRPHFVDTDFNPIAGSETASVTATATYDAEQRACALDALPEDHEIKLTAVLPDGKGVRDFTTHPMRSGNGDFMHDFYGSVAYVALDKDEQENGLIEAEHQPHSADLYVVCRPAGEASNFTLSFKENTIKGGSVKTQDVTDRVLQYMTESGDVSGWSTFYAEVDNVEVDAKAVTSDGVAVTPGAKVTVKIYRGKIKTRGIPGPTGWSRLEGWQFANSNLSPFVTENNEYQIERVDFTMPASPVHLDAILRELPSVGDSDNDQRITFTGTLEVKAGDKVVSPEEAGLTLVSTDCIDPNVALSDLPNMAYYTKTYKVNKNYSGDSPVELTIKAYDLPSSVSKECVFAHWIYYYDSKGSFGPDEDSGPVGYDREYKVTIGDRTNLSDGDSFRLVPSYTTPKYSANFVGPDGSPSTGGPAVAGTVVPADPGVVEWTVSDPDNSPWSITGIECNYMPIKEEKDSYGNVTRVSDSNNLQSYSGYTFTPTSGSLAEGNCKQGTIKVKLPQGDVFVKAVTNAPKHTMTMKVQNKQINKVVCEFSQGETVQFDCPLELGERVKVISSDPSNLPYSVDNVTGRVRIENMPNSDATITLETYTPNRELCVPNGKVYLNGNSTNALIPGPGNVYIVPQGSSVMIVPQPSSGAVCDKWDIEGPGGKMPEDFTAITTQDGNLFFRMPADGLKCVPHFVEKRVVSGAVLALGSSIEAGTSLPAFAVVESDDLSKDTVSVSWKPSYGTDKGLITNNVSYKATVTISPADGATFLQDKDANGNYKFALYLKNGDEEVRVDGKDLTYKNGSFTGTYTFQVPALQITSIEGQKSLEGIQNGLQVDQAWNDVRSKLSKAAVVTLADGSTYEVPVVWDKSSFEYDPAATASQSLVVRGTAQLNGGHPFITDGLFKNYEFAADGMTAQVVCTVTTEANELAAPTANVAPGAYVVESSKDVALSSKWNTSSSTPVAIKYVVDSVARDKDYIDQHGITYNGPVQLTPEGDAAKKRVISCYAIANQAIADGDKVIPAGAQSQVASYEYSISSTSAPTPAEVTLSVTNGTGGGTYHVGDKVTVVADTASTGAQLEKWTSGTQGFQVPDGTGAVYTFTMPANNVELTANLIVTAVDLDMKAPVAGEAFPNTAKFVSGTGVGIAEQPYGEVGMTFLKNGQTVEETVAESGAVYTARIVLRTLPGFKLSQGDKVAFISYETPEGYDIGYAAIAYVEADNKYVLTLNMPQTGPAPAPAPKTLTVNVPDGVNQATVKVNGAKQSPAASYQISSGSTVTVIPAVVSGKVSNIAFNPAVGSVEADGQVTFKMPADTDNLTITVTYDNVPDPISNVKLRLVSNLQPGASLPASAVVTAPAAGIKQSASAITWTKVSGATGASTGVAEYNSGYSAEFDIAPAKGYAFPSDLSKMTISLATAEDETNAIACSLKRDGQNNIIVNPDGSVTAVSAPILTDPLWINSVASPTSLDGLANRLTEEAAVQYLKDNLSTNAVVELSNGNDYNVQINWNYDKVSYDPDATSPQKLQVTGTLSLTSKPFVTESKFKNYKYIDGLSDKVVCQVVTVNPNPQGALESPTVDVLPGPYVVDASGLTVRLSSAWNNPMTRAASDKVAIWYVIDKVEQGMDKIVQRYDAAKPLVLTPADPAAEYVISCYAEALENIADGSKIIKKGTKSAVAHYKYTVSAPVKDNTVKVKVVNGISMADNDGYEATYTYKVGQKVRVVGDVPIGSQFVNWTSNAGQLKSDKRTFELEIPEIDGLELYANMSIIDGSAYIDAPVAGKELAKKIFLVGSRGITEYDAGEQDEERFYVDVTFFKDGVQVPAGAVAEKGVEYEARVTLHTQDHFTLDGFDFYVQFPDDTSDVQHATIQPNPNVPGEYVVSCKFRTEAPEYSVSFNLQGHGDAIKTQQVKKGEKAAKPDAPKADGYTFGGWFLDADCTKAYDFDTPVTADVALYAKWTKVVPGPTPGPTPTPDPSPSPSPDGPGSDGASGSAATGDALVQFAFGAAGLALLALLTLLGASVLRRRRND